MTLILWRIYLVIVKINIKGLHWLVRKYGNNYDLYSFGELILDFEEAYPGKRTKGANIVLRWLVRTGLEYMDEAVHNEAFYIKRLYNIDLNTDIDTVPEITIEEYFGDRMSKVL